MHKSQIFGAALLAFLLGTAMASAVAVSGNWILFLIGVSFACMIVAGYFALSREEKLSKQKVFLIGLIFLCFSGGAYRFSVANAGQSVLNQFIGLEAGGKTIEFTFRGYVDGEITKDNSRFSFQFRIKEIVTPKLIIPVNDRILVQGELSQPAKFGDPLEIVAPLLAPTNSGEFDYVMYLKKQGIRAVAKSPKIKSLDKDLNLGAFEKARLSIFRPIFNIKNRFEKSVGTSIASPNSAYINGILLGSRQNIPDSLRKDFNRTGTSHVLAISGYNITLVAETLLGLLLWRWRRQKAILIAIAGIAVFTVMTGASASVVRAAVMGSVVLIASGIGRLSDARNAVLFTAAVMIAFNPFLLVFDVGFQLSFAAVLGLIYVYPSLQNKFGRRDETGGIREIALMTLSAQIAVLPLLVGYFKTISLFSLPANILILPFMPAVMLLGFISGVAGMILPIAGKVLGLAAWAVSEYQLSVVRLFSHLPWSSVDVSISWPIIVAVYFFGAFTLWRLRTSSNAKV